MHNGKSSRQEKLRDEMKQEKNKILCETNVQEGVVWVKEDQKCVVQACTPTQFSLLHLAPVKQPFYGN